MDSLVKEKNMATEPWKTLAALLAISRSISLMKNQSPNQIQILSRTPILSSRINSTTIHPRWSKLYRQKPSATAGGFLLHTRTKTLRGENGRLAIEYTKTQAISTTANWNHAFNRNITTTCATRWTLIAQEIAYSKGQRLEVALRQTSRGRVRDSFNSLRVDQGEIMACVNKNEGSPLAKIDSTQLG